MFDGWFEGCVPAMDFFESFFFVFQAEIQYSVISALIWFCDFSVYNTCMSCLFSSMRITIGIEKAFWISFGLENSVQRMLDLVSTFIDSSPSCRVQTLGNFVHKPMRWMRCNWVWWLRRLLMSFGVMRCALTCCSVMIVAVLRCLGDVCATVLCGTCEKLFAVLCNYVRVCAVWCAYVL